MAFADSMRRLQIDALKIVRFANCHFHKKLIYLYLEINHVQFHIFFLKAVNITYWNSNFSIDNFNQEIEIVIGNHRKSIIQFSKVIFLSRYWLNGIVPSNIVTLLKKVDHPNSTTPTHALIQYIWSDSHENRHTRVVTSKLHIYL